MTSQKVATTILSRRTILPAIRYQRFFATDKKEPLSHGPGLHTELKDTVAKPRKGDFATAESDKKVPLNHGPLPPHTLASQYKDRIQPSRVGREADPLTGIKPTASQKYFLVLTRVFKTQSEIPEYVPNQTMKIMHNRMRGIVIITAFFSYIIIRYTSEWRMRRQMDIDKASGKIVKTWADIK
uniref:Uncharacterized protein n=1 Tax=Panagrolaimus davidi TaxID=227884 RepID=A0A914QK22_9BILA